MFNEQTLNWNNVTFLLFLVLVVYHSVDHVLPSLIVVYIIAAYMVYVQEEVNVLIHALDPPITQSLTQSLNHSRTQSPDYPITHSIPQSLIRSFTLDTILSIDGCHIEHNGKRGVYAYHTCTLYMKDSIVSGTESDELAAIDVWSCSGDISCRITPSNTPLTDDGLNAADHDPPNSIHTAGSGGSEYDELSSSSHIGQTITDTNPIPSTRTFLSTPLGSSTITPLSVDFKSIKSSIHTPGQLSVYLSNCQIYDNKGIGIRIIHQNDDGLNGMIDNCCCYHNMRGNYVTFQHNLSTTTSTTNVIAEEVIDESDQQQRNTPQDLSSTRIYIWEYERDDPLNKNEHGWKSYDATVACFLEQQWHLYLQKQQPIVKTSPECLDDEDDDENNSSSVHSFSLCSPYEKYFIDLKTMIQTNLETHYTRRIHRRLQVS